LRKTAADRYSVELDLPPGKYEFKFVINNTDWRVNSQMYDSVDDGSGNTNNVLEVSLASDPYTDIKEDSQKASEQTPLLGVGSSKGASKARTSFDTDAELESQSGSTGEQDEGRAEDSEDGSDGVGSWRNKARRYIICAAAVLAIAALGLTGGMLYS
ncbi:hypothetical protein IWW45_008471, partial [Coemansia sp. RSA 485]